MRRKREEEAKRKRQMEEVVTRRHEQSISQSASLWCSGSSLAHTTHVHTHTWVLVPMYPVPSVPQMEKERQRRREARLAAAEVQENGREDLGVIGALNKKTSGAGEFDDLISALRSGDVFGVGDLPGRSRPGKGGGSKGRSAPKRRGNDGRERDSSRTAFL